jgi:hypothetical protein
MAGLGEFFTNFLTSPRLWDAVATGMQVAGKLEQGDQQAAYGEALQKAAEFEAAQLRDQANEAFAASQRAAWSEERAARYLMSETLARAAASGGGASDPTVINIIARQAQEGAYRQQVALYEGSERAHLLRMQATAREYEGATRAVAGRNAERGSNLAAAASLLGGFSRDASMLQRFGGDGPSLPGTEMGY